MTVLRWEDPPRPLRRRTDWREVARQLRSRPGVWALVYEGPSPQSAGGQMSNLRAGRVAAMNPADEFEYERRGTALYARWHDDPEPAEDLAAWLPDRRCGTQAGAKAHRRAGQPLCESCRAAENRAGRKSA